MKLKFRLGSISGEQVYDEGYTASIDVLEDDPSFSPLYATVNMTLRLDHEWARRIRHEAMSGQVVMESMPTIKPADPKLERSIKL